jgi:hypothetical protein
MWAVLGGFMFFFDKTKSIQIIDSLGFQFENLINREFESISRIKNAYRVVMPNNKPLRMGRDLLDCLDVRGSQPGSFWLAYVFETGIWPSSEDLYTYYALRRYNGDVQQVSVGPGHHFHWYEYAELLSFLNVFLRSGWGCLLCGNNSEGLVYFDHDDRLAICDLKLDGSVSRRAGLYFPQENKQV